MTTSPATPPDPRGTPDPVDAYLRALADAIRGIDRAAIWQAADVLVAANRARRRIYLVGNGGSSATASHIANDLAKKACVDGHPPFRAICLADNVPLLTAWSNDVDYRESFARQLVNHIEPDDVLIAISTSGNSPNVLRAVEVAREAGARTIGLSGDTGGRLRDMVELCILVPSPDIGHQEDAHMALDHALCHAIHARLAAD